MKRLSVRILALILAVIMIAVPASALSVDEAVDLLERHFLYEIPENAENAEDLTELFSKLGDPYTFYMDEQQYKDFYGFVEGSTSLVGIGVQVLLTERGIEIVAPVSGSPAEQAGLMQGDIIIAVNGVSCVPATGEHQEMITGEEGTAVTITVKRGDVVSDYTLIRRQVVVKSILYRQLGNRIGYIGCSTFSSSSHMDFAEIMAAHNNEVDSWVVDLRDNPGGHVNALVVISGLFAGEGTYLYLRDRQGDIEAYRTSQPAATKSPVVVLVNGNSASASEAYAANILDTGSGVVIGSRTVGKGTAQEVYDAAAYPGLFQGDGIKITTQRFYSYNGNTTDMIGVIPTLLMDSDSAYDLAQALKVGPQNSYMTEGCLKLQIAGWELVFDTKLMEKSTLSDLLAALPPSASVFEGTGYGGWQVSTREQIAARYGTGFKSRTFDDISQSEYADEINTLGTYLLLLGDGTGKFMPDRQLTRAEICAMLAQLLNVTYSGPSLFSDVSRNAWYASSINAMAYLGFVEGVGNGMFRPNDILTQQEYFTILGRMARHLNFKLDDFADTFHTADGTSLLDQDQQLAEYAVWARESTAVLDRGSKVLGGSKSMLFTELSKTDPKAPILREEAASCLYRMLSTLGILGV